jgi:maltose/maltodextrin transport system permease protein
MNRTVVKWGAAAVVTLLALYIIHGIYLSGEPVLAVLCLAASALAIYVYTSTRAQTYRYLFPGLAGITIFVVLPLVYTISLGFTRYRSENFLTFERATIAFLGETYEREGDRYRISLYGDGAGFRVMLEPFSEQPEEPEDEGSIFGDDEGEGAEGAAGQDAGAAGGAAGEGGEGGEGGAEAAAGGEEDSIFADDGDEDSIFADDGDAGSDSQDAGQAANAAPAGGEPGQAGEQAAAEPADEAGGEPAAAEAAAGPAAAEAAAGPAGEAAAGPPGEAAAGPAEAAAGPPGDGAGGAAPARKPFITGVVALAGVAPAEASAVPLDAAGFRPGEPLPRAELIKRRDALQALTVRFPDGTWAVKDKLSLDVFLPQAPLYHQNPDGSITNEKTGEVLRPNFETGFYETEAGQLVRPGFRTFAGLDNYARIFTDRRMQEPFLRIFSWTVIFAGLTVLLTLIVGVLLAEILSWEALRLRGLYQMLLFLPYAVPGFISILVFKGLFNPASGEINHILEALFGVRLDWFGNPFLAKTMILIVNTWLGYPYILLLWMGLKKSVPSDLYEASALAGAGPLTNFFKITWPLIRRPLTPLLISSFAFNFNNFVLIFLLTGGRPDFLDTTTPAGETDILVSYTYRIAFQDSGQNYGLAGAISTMIFVLVALLSVVNLRLTNVNKVEKR